MYIVGITPEDYYDEATLLARNAKLQQIRTNKHQIDRALNEKTAKADGTITEDIPRCPTVKRISESLFTKDSQANSH